MAFLLGIVLKLEYKVPEIAFLLGIVLKLEYKVLESMLGKLSALGNSICAKIGK